MLIARTGNTVCTADGRLEPGQKSSVAEVGKCRLLDTVRVCLISLNNICIFDCSITQFFTMHG